MMREQLVCKAALLILNCQDPHDRKNQTSRHKSLPCLNRPSMVAHVRPCVRLCSSRSNIALFGIVVAHSQSKLE